MLWKDMHWYAVLLLRQVCLLRPPPVAVIRSLIRSIVTLHQPQVPAYYALILRSLTVLEGLALSADPDYKLLAKAYPYMAKRLLTDPNPQLR